MESIYRILKNFRCTYLRSWNWFVCTGSAPLPPDIQQDQVFTVQYLFTFSKAGLCVQVVHHYLQTASRTKSVLYSTCLPSWNWFVWTSCEPLPPDSQQNHVCTVHCTVLVYLAETGYCVYRLCTTTCRQPAGLSLYCTLYSLCLPCSNWFVCTGYAPLPPTQPAGSCLHCTVLVYLAETGLRVQVVHHYLQTASRTMQSRLRKRGRMGKWSYIHTIRKQVSGQVIEVKTPLTHQDYTHLLDQQDPLHLTVNKIRRCFLYNNQYFQMDIYKEPCHPRCRGLMLLETYSTLSPQELRDRLPKFLHLDEEVCQWHLFNGGER